LFKTVEAKGKRYDRAMSKIEGEVIRRDTGETNRRSRFLFLETGKRKVRLFDLFILLILLIPLILDFFFFFFFSQLQQKGEITVREKDGTLRTGSNIEREDEQRKFGVWTEKDKAFYIRQL
jgi:hypothetical protein